MMVGLEPLFQSLRIRKVAPYIRRGVVFVDAGCDEELVLLKRYAPLMKKAYGIDIVPPTCKYRGFTMVQADLEKKIPLPSSSVDTITMLAVLEHLKGPERILQEMCRLLQPGGQLLVTVPTPKSEPILEFLAAIRLVRPEMIRQHETYFTPKLLRSMAKKAGFSKVYVEEWEVGFNLFLRAEKGT